MSTGRRVYFDGSPQYTQGSIDTSDRIISFVPASQMDGFVEKLISGSCAIFGVSEDGHDNWRLVALDDASSYDLGRVADMPVGILSRRWRAEALSVEPSSLGDKMPPRIWSDLLDLDLFVDELSPGSYKAMMAQTENILNISEMRVIVGLSELERRQK